jgi:hypothetical protein
MDERRQHIRRSIQATCEIVPTTMTVRVVDIGEGGVLLEGEHEVEVGMQGRLEFVIGRTPFKADVTVHRVAGGLRATGTHKFAAVFESLTAAHREVLERFMKP